MQRQHPRMWHPGGGILRRLGLGAPAPEGAEGASPARTAKGALRRLLVPALLLALLAATAWWLGRAAEVKVAAVTRGDAAEVAYATGIVEPTYWAKVSALHRKRIVEICDCEGRAVSKGEVLARLDGAEERAVLTEFTARLARFREDAARLRMLLDRNATSRTAYEDKLTQVREYEARVQAQQDRIADLELKAPMDGIVLRRDGEVGEIAGTGSSDVLLWVGQPRPLRVVAEVNEDDIVKVREGMRALLRHEGHTGAPLTATVGSITPKGDPQTKTFRVYLVLPDDTSLKIGMSVEANIIVREVKGALLLPSEAIVNGSVLVLDNGRLRRIAVDVGIRGTRMAEIRGGLAAGQTVVSPHRADLKDGARARPAPAAPK